MLHLRGMNNPRNKERDWLSSRKLMVRNTMTLTPLTLKYYWWWFPYRNLQETAWITQIKVLLTKLLHRKSEDCRMQKNLNISDKIQRSVTSGHWVVICVIACKHAYFGFVVVNRWTSENSWKYVWGFVTSWIAWPQSYRFVITTQSFDHMRSIELQDGISDNENSIWNRHRSRNFITRKYTQLPKTVSINFG